MFIAAILLLFSSSFKSELRQVLTVASRKQPFCGTNTLTDTLSKLRVLVYMSVKT